MDTKVDGLDLQVGGHDGDFRPEVIERTKLMLRTVLEAAGKHGIWRYRLTGPCESLGNPSRFSLEVRAASEHLPNMVYVATRSSLGPGGTVSGMLTPQPPMVVTDDLITAMALGAQVFNRSNWLNILTPEVRQQAFDVGRPAVVTPLKQAKRTPRPQEDDERPTRRVPTVDGQSMLRRVREEALVGRPRVVSVTLSQVARDLGSCSELAVPSSSQMVPPPQSRGSAGPVERSVNFSTTWGKPAPAQSSKEAAMSTETHEAKLARVLQQLLVQPAVKNGVFTGKGIVETVQPIFPDKQRGWHRRGVLYELIHRRWIRAVGQGEYQVEQSFVLEHQLELVIEPRSKVEQGAQLNGSKPNGHAPEPESFESLLAQRKALDQKIRDQALNEQKSRQDAISVLRAQLAEAEADLADFNAKYAEPLAPVPQA